MAAQMIPKQSVAAEQYVRVVCADVPNKRLNFAESSEESQGVRHISRDCQNRRINLIVNGCGLK